MQEEWRPVVGWEGWYSVSNLGRVRSEDRVVETKSGPRRYSGQVLACFVNVDRGGYVEVILSCSNPQRKFCYKVHHLVLEAFIGPRPDGCEARHLDLTTSNNRADNLAWGTPEQNQADKRAATGADPNSKLNILQVQRIRVLLAEGKPINLIAKLVNSCESNIRKIRDGKSWKHLSCLNSIMPTSLRPTELSTSTVERT